MPVPVGVLSYVLDVVAVPPTGGTITTVGGYRYHTFTTNGVFDPLESPINVEYLVVGGGGGGGYNSPGVYYPSGGAGGTARPGSAIVTTPQTVTIGAGGLWVGITNTPGQNGGSSVFGSVTATGGGGGGSPGPALGGNNADFNGSDVSGNGGGAGAGAGASAGAGSTNGGNGYTWLNGSTYGGGAAGRANASGTYGSGGTGGGAAAASAAANTGGGSTGGDGGSGIVIVRYLWPPPPALGGTITTPGDGYRYHKFTADTTFQILGGPLNVDVLVVGGGGGGAARGGGGGGAGGYRIGSYTISANQAVTVGAGGIGGFAASTSPTNGASSSFGALLTSLGGGYGAGGAVSNPNSGASGGGGRTFDNTGTFGAGTAGQGNNGGAGNNSSVQSGAGGGGGAGAVGQNSTASPDKSGDGGIGLQWLDGNYYAGGGGGGRYQQATAGLGGLGGGGNGAVGATSGAAGTANTGGGGGGAGEVGGGANNSGGAGGSGVVIVRYPHGTAMPFGGAITTPGDGYRYHTFSPGTTSFTINALAGAFIPTNIEYLILGGGSGGSGGTSSVNYGAGGAGGTRRVGTFSGMTPGAYPVVVGTGGTAGQGSSSGSAASGVGGTSSFNGVSATGGTSVTIATRIGGGNADFAGGQETTGVGCGGGAGAGAIGVGCVPGAGVEWPVGSGQRYGGGGGGILGGSNVAQAGGAGGGGAASTSAGGTAGTDGRGGGGGGGTSTGGGGKGGNGVVILRYQVPITWTYQELLLQQGVTNYWECQTARATSAVEPDLIGARPMTLARGSVPALAAGQGPLGVADKGITFVAADLEQLETGTAVSTLQNWSWSGWFRGPAATGNGPVLLYLKTGTNSYVMLLHRDDKAGICLQVDSGAGAVFLDPGTYQVGTSAWRHVALTRAYSTTNTLDVWTMYLDGVQIGQGTAASMGFTATGTGATSSMAFAGRWDTSIAANQWEGDLAHVSLALGVTLTPGQIAAQSAMRAA